MRFNECLNHQFFALTSWIRYIDTSNKVSELTASRGKLFHRLMILLINDHCNKQKGLCKLDDCTSDYMKMTWLVGKQCHKENKQPYF